MDAKPNRSVARETGQKNAKVPLPFRVVRLFRRHLIRVHLRGSAGLSTPAVIPKRAGGAVFEVLAPMLKRSQQHAQMLPQRIKMGLARGGHEWMPVLNDDLLFPFQRQLL